MSSSTSYQVFIPQLQFIDKSSTLDVAKQQIDSLIKNKPLLKLVKINFALLGLTAILTGVFYNFLPPEVPVFFSKPWGQEQLSPKNYIFIIPAILLILFIIQIRVASANIKKERLISQLVIWTQLVNTLLALIYVIQLIILLA